MGIIDVLASGYRLINRRLWLLVIPISLDLLFWAGPRIGLNRLTSTVPWLIPNASGDDPLQTVPASLDLSFLLALHIRTLLGRPFADGGPGVGESAPAAFGVVAALALIPVGLLFASLYLSGMAQLVRGGSGTIYGWPFYAFRVWRKAILLHGLYLALFILLGIPWLLLLVLTAIISQVLSVVTFLLLQVAMVWVALSLYFAFPAVVMAGHGPVRAVQASIRLIRSNFWPSVGLIGLTLLISTGTPLVWRALGSQPPGLLIAIIGNAYVMTGLAAATLLFYHDRSRQLDAPPRATPSSVQRDRPPL